MNSIDALAVSNYALAFVIIGVTMLVRWYCVQIITKLSELAHKLDLVLGYNVEEEFRAWTEGEDRGAEAAPRDEFWRRSAQPPDRP